jgi:hypothetical protein
VNHLLLFTVGPALALEQGTKLFMAESRLAASQEECEDYKLQLAEALDTAVAMIDIAEVATHKLEQSEAKDTRRDEDVAFFKAQVTHLELVIDDIQDRAADLESRLKQGPVTSEPPPPGIAMQRSEDTWYCPDCNFSAATPLNQLPFTMVTDEPIELSSSLPFSSSLSLDLEWSPPSLSSPSPPPAWAEQLFELVDECSTVDNSPTSLAFNVNPILETTEDATQFSPPPTPDLVDDDGFSDSSSRPGTPILEEETVYEPSKQSSSLHALSHCFEVPDLVDDDGSVETCSPPCTPVLDDASLSNPSVSLSPASGADRSSLPEVNDELSVITPFPRKLRPLRATSYSPRPMLLAGLLIREAYAGCKQPVPPLPADEMDAIAHIEWIAREPPAPVERRFYRVREAGQSEVACRIACPVAEAVPNDGRLIETSKLRVRRSPGSRIPMARAS